MNRPQRNRLLGFVLLMTVGTLATEAWWLRHEWQRARQNLAALGQKQQERDQLVRQVPEPNVENEEAVGRQLAGAEKSLQELQAVFQNSAAETGGGATPAKPLDSFFELADFVENTRTLAARAQVLTKADERFGFASHANEGPAPEFVPAVHRQCIELQYLLETLIKARPQALLAVQREHPGSAALESQGNGPGMVRTVAARPTRTSAASGDFFDFDETLSLRVPGLVATDAYRLEFTGQTLVVQTFLNTLAASAKTVAIRRIEVEPVSVGTTAVERRPTSVTETTMPLVVPNLSRFAVVVEFVELIAPPKTAAP